LNASSAMTRPTPGCCCAWTAQGNNSEVGSGGGQLGWALGRTCAPTRLLCHAGNSQRRACGKARLGADAHLPALKQPIGARTGKVAQCH
jgi:hypothetical protein